MLQLFSYSQVYTFNMLQLFSYSQVYTCNMLQLFSYSQGSVTINTLHYLSQHTVTSTSSNMEEKKTWWKKIWQVVTILLRKELMKFISPRVLQSLKPVTQHSLHPVFLSHVYYSLYIGYHHHYFLQCKHLYWICFNLRRKILNINCLTLVVLFD